MAMKEICVDCLCLQLLAIRESAENPQKVVELVNELLEEYDDIRPTPRALDVAYECPKCGTALEKDGWCDQHGLPAQPRQ